MKNSFVGWIMVIHLFKDRVSTMPYKNISDLPAPVRDHLPKHAQEIFKEAFNSAWNEYADPGKRRGYDSREEVAYKIAWAAVKHQYVKGEDDDWHRK